MGTDSEKCKFYSVCKTAMEFAFRIQIPSFRESVQKGRLLERVNWKGIFAYFFLPWKKVGEKEKEPVKTPFCTNLLFFQGTLLVLTVQQPVSKPVYLPDVVPALTLE